MQPGVRLQGKLHDDLPEAGEQARRIGGLEMCAVAGQLQPQLLPGDHHHGHRVVGMCAVAPETNTQLAGARLQALIQRCVLEHEQAVEQAAPTRHAAQGLDLHQRQVLMLAHHQVVCQ
ncbi:hypothetical protein D3C71_1266770 [compost metagenome]